MRQFHHKPIKRLYLDGEIFDEAAIPRLKNEYIRLLWLQMKATGYVPRLDMEPDFTIEYVEEKNIFRFKLSVYGVYVGRKSSQWILGIDGTKAISIQRNKSKEYSQEQV